MIVARAADRQRGGASQVAQLGGDRLARLFVIARRADLRCRESGRYTGARAAWRTGCAAACGARGRSPARPASVASYPPQASMASRRSHHGAMHEATGVRQQLAKSSGVRAGLPLRGDGLGPCVTHGGAVASSMNATREVRTVRVRIAVELRELFARNDRRREIVRILPGDELAARDRQAGIQRRGDARAAGRRSRRRADRRAPRAMSRDPSVLPSSMTISSKSANDWSRMLAERVAEVRQAVTDRQQHRDAGAPAQFMTSRSSRRATRAAARAIA